jgi:hypothetical protein
LRNLPKKKNPGINPGQPVRKGRKKNHEQPVRKGRKNKSWAARRKRANKKILKKKTLVLTLGSPSEKGGEKKTLVLTLGRPPDLDGQTSVGHVGISKFSKNKTKQNRQ